MRQVGDDTRRNWKVWHGGKVAKNWHVVSGVLFQLPHNGYFTLFKIKTEKDKFGKGLKAKIGFVFQVINVIAPIKTRGHSPSPVFKKNASKNFAQHSQKLGHLLLQNFWFCFSLGYYRTCSRVTSDDTYILNKKYEVSPKLVFFESTTCKQC